MGGSGFFYGNLKNVLNCLEKFKKEYVKYFRSEAD
jgi:hypothetical protein